MIKKLSIIMLLIALFAPWAVNAQETLTVHDGTTTNSYVPFYGLWVDDYTRSEMIYPADELSSMTDGVISSLTFYKNSTSTNSWGASFQVYLNEVTSTSLSAYIGMTNATIVYQGSIDASGGERQVTINFTTPYYYNGGNLLVGIYETTTGSYSSAYWYGENVSGASASGYNTSDPASATFNQRGFLPKTTFTYEPNNSNCPKPTDVAVSDITTNGATISWTGSSDSYVVMVKESNQPELTDFTYDFEDGTSQGWTTLKGSNGDSPNNWHHSTTHVSYDGNTGELHDWSSYGHNNSSGFMISESYISSTSSGSTAYGAVTPDNYLVSPQVPLGGSISFYAGARNTDYCAEKFSVMVSTTDNTNTASFTTVETWILSLSAAGYTSSPYTVDLSAYAGQTGYIAIRHWDCYDQWVLCIDDITITTGEDSAWTTYPASASPFTINDLNPETTYTVQVMGICGDEESPASTAVSFTTEVSCPAPTNVTVNDITAHEATVTWTGSSESYIVMIGEPQLVNNTVDFEDQMIPSTWDNDATYPWVVTNAAANGGSYSIKSGNYNVHNTTSSIQVTTTYSENGTISFAARCSSEQTAQSYDWDYGTFYIDGVQQGDKITNSTTFTTYTYNVEAGTHTFMWRYKKDGSTNTNDDCLYVDDITIPVPITSTWTEYTTTDPTYTFDGLTPGTLYEVKVKGDCGEEGISAESSPITFTTNVSCPIPTDVTVSDVTAHEATVTWTGSSESYLVNYRISSHYEFINANFESGSLPDGWTIEGNNTWSVGTGDYSASTGAHDGNYNAIISHSVSGDVTYLVTPNMNLSGRNDLTLSLWYINRAWAGDTDGFGVYYRIEGGAWNEIFATTASHSTWTHFNETLPTGAYVSNCQIGFKFTDNYGYGVGLDDITLEGLDEASEWQSISTTDNVIVLTDLTPETLYEVVVQGDCGDEGLSATSEPVTFTTEISCPAPTNLNVSDINGHGATVSWDRIATQETGRITFNYVCVANGDTLNWDNASIIIDDVDNPNPPTVNLTGLDPETTYTFYVRKDCGEEGYSAEVMISFTTTITCPAPTNVTVSDITGHTANVTWTGFSDSYIVMYRTAAYLDGIEEGFDSGSLPSGWENKTGLLSNILNGTALSDSYQWYFGNNNGVFDYHARINIYGSSRYGWLITPEINLGNGFGISFDLALTAYSGTGAASGTCDDDRFVVLVFADNAWHILREWNNSGSTDIFNNIPTAGQNVSIDLSAYAGKTVKIAFYGESTTTGNGDNNLHIDNVAIGLPIAAGEWQTVTAEEASVTLTGLTSETLYEVVVQGDCGDEGLSADSDPTTFTTDVTCPAPTGLAVSEISGHGATVSWDRIATQETGRITFNYVCVANGDTLNWDNAFIIIDDVDNPNPPTVNLTGLDPETTYTFYVRKDCGEEGYSAVVMVTFTTDVTCPVPTEMNVSDITGHEATVTWTGYSENYVVEVGSYDYTATPTTGIIQEEDFEGGSMPTDWTHIGNGSVNMYSSNSSHVHDGTYSLQFSGATADNVLVLPQFAARPSSLQISFWSKCESTSYSGQFDFGYVTDASDASSFVAVETYTASQHSSYQYVENISITTAPANARIAFRHRSGSTAWYWFIDDITIKGPVYPMIWTEYTTDDPTYTFEGLTPETTYFVSVQGDCGDEGMSAISDTITFITDISCPAPTPQEPTNVTSSSAVLNWTGDAESYNVSYFKTFFFDSFEEDLSQWTIYKEGDDASWEWGIENPHDNSADLNAHSGNYAAVAYSDVDVHADSWLVSPQILFPTQTQLKFWIMRSTYDDAPDEYEVLLSTTGNAIEDFTVIKEKVAANSTWTEVVIDLSEYDGQQGYIAIRHDFTGGFFIMVDDFGIYGWSEPIATTDNSLLIEDLLPETEYLWHVQANCEGEDQPSQWSNFGIFTTLPPCPVPFDLNVTEVTANGATIAWTGYNDSYEVMVSEGTYMSYDFEDNAVSADFTTTTNYPWTVVANNHSGAYCAKSGNGGISSSTSDMVLEVTLTEECMLSFTAMVSSESSYDKAYFTIDDNFNINGISGAGSWIDYSYPLAAGTHTLRWYYTKDSSVNTNDDCFYVDDITIQSSNVSSWISYTATESPFILNDATNILPETTYSVKVIGFCDGEATEDSEIITFKTLDENTKIFVIEGDWSDGDNWVPAGVPSIEQDVILRAEATVFDIAEANNITIDDAGALTIEDGGQLKTNADVEATMKKFIIGYGTDYVETNDGYYLMALPTAAPISATDAGLMSEESDYDLYGWDRTATDEEWQNNHDGIDLQNGIGFLYANRDDMEMSFTATLRNSSEPITLTAEYDDVEHGGWNLYGNPFPCEAYLTTEAEGMTFYRLIGNELVPFTGAIAPLEAFFVKATAAGQTFTISREAPEESK